PSPALITADEDHLKFASCSAAPEAQCRITMASPPMASSVWTVSLRDSPFDTEDVLTAKFKTSADSRLAAASNEVRVRVESSKKRLTTVCPRRVGSLLMERAETVASSCAVSRIAMALSYDRFRGAKR